MRKPRRTEDLAAGVAGQQRRTQAGSPAPAIPEPLGRILDVLPALVGYVDSNQRYQFNNAAYERWFGVSREEMKDTHVREWLGADYEIERRRIEAAMGGEPQSFDTQHHSKSGPTRGLQVHFIPHRNDTGEVIGFYVLGHDISERFRIEDQLRVNEARLNAAQKVAKIGFREFDLSKGTRWWSRESYELFGINPETELSRESILEVVHPDDRARLANAMDGSYEGVPHSLDFRVILPDGSERTLNSRGRLIRDENGAPLRFIGTTYDITDRVALERRMLSIRERERQRIGQDLHDGLGQVLTGVSLGLETLRQKLEREGSDHVPSLRDLTTMVQKSVAETRRMARILAPGLGVESFQSTLHALAAEVSEHSNVAVRVTCSPTIAFGAAETMLQLFRLTQEAVNNAIRHGHAGSVEVVCRAEDGIVHVEVLDDGIGIPPEEERTEGVGLGSMRQRAQLIGGRLEITKRSAGGTRVHCSYPVTGKSGDGAFAARKQTSTIHEQENA